jgi:hypothetical protein
MKSIFKPEGATHGCFRALLIGCRARAPYGVAGRTKPGRTLAGHNYDNERDIEDGIDGRRLPDENERHVSLIVRKMDNAVSRSTSKAVNPVRISEL